MLIARSGRDLCAQPSAIGASPKVPFDQAMKKANMVWLSSRDTDLLCKRLAEKIDKSEFKPDMIVAVVRGGMVPSRMLSDLLDVSDILSVRIKFYTAPGKTAQEPMVRQMPDESLFKGKKILIVDDVADSGRTLALAKSLFEKGVEVRTATLHYKPLSSIIKPDYFVEETSAWIVYPWEREETERDMLDEKKK